MNSRITRSDPDVGVSVSVVVSAVIHLAVFLLLFWRGDLFPQRIDIQETYYVDVVTLPTVDPQAGQSVQKSAMPEAPVPHALTPPMTIPSKSATKAGIKPAKLTSSREAGETESEFEQNLSKLAPKAEAQQYEEKLKKLGSKKTAGTGKIGTPTGAGAEAGSHYADFIKSRLEDALKDTSFYTTQKPEVSVRMTISAEGKLLNAKIERTSGDAAFELAVMRAIDLASKRFKAPPNNAVFENGFVFRPKGITQGTFR